jgi:hypothetical protein
MRKTIILLLIIFCLAPTAKAYRYAFDSIPEPLRKNATAVMRSNQMVCDLYSPGKMKVTYKEAITLLNKVGERYRSVYIPYDEFSTVSSITTHVYDRNGKLIDVLKKADIQDISVSEDLASDNRAKHILFPKYSYPYTIEYEYTISCSSSLGIPNWEFQPSTDVSVEESGVQYIIPENLNFRFREFYLTNSPDSIVSDHKKIYTWVENNIPAFRKWYFTSLSMAQRPRLLAATDKFCYAGRNGTYSSWKNYGDWTYQLIKDLDELPPAEMQKVKDLVAGVSDDKEKVKILYRYMQSKTRYVSIQLGIGGLRPFPASFVSEKGYGDCKALSNYMMALLKAAGIKSYYTYVRSGEHQNIVPDLITDQFNHIILCVPLEKETVWLECTNQLMPFNFLGGFTADRSVLLITPDGGRIERTPAMKNNVVKTTGIIDVKRGGNSTAAITTENNGIYYDESMGYLNMSEDEIKRYLNQSIPLGTFNVTDASFINNNEENPVSKISYKLKIRDFLISGQNCIHFYPNIEKMDFPVYDSLGIRCYETTVNIDSIAFNVPSGYEFEFVPEDVEVSNQYGTFSRKMIVSDGKLVMQRQLTINKGRYNSSEAIGFYDFIKAVAIADHQKVVLKDKTPW